MLIKVKFALAVGDKNVIFSSPGLRSAGEHSLSASIRADSLVNPAEKGFAVSQNFAHLRNRVLPTWQSTEAEDPMAMVLVVNNAHDTEVVEQAVLSAAVTACVSLLLDERPAVQAAVDRWLSGRIRKIVKRARNKAWDDLSALELAHSFATSGEAQVLAFAPVRVSEQPKALRRLQVSGLDFPKASPASTQFSGLEILLDARLAMSTGKAVAQVCHAAQLFVMQGSEARVQHWLAANCPTRFTYSQDLAAEARDIEVRDAGFTEVAPNTLTVAARYV